MYHLRQIMSTLAEDGRSIILVTHYPEDIVPEIDRILLIKDAAVFADGSKERLLTSEVMSDLFSVPLTVAKHDAGIRSTNAAHITDGPLREACRLYAAIWKRDRAMA